MESLVIEMSAEPVLAARRPIIDHTVVTNLRRVGPVDPAVALTGPLRTLEVIRLPAGATVALRADAVEHALFVASGGGHAASGDDRVPLGPGMRLTLPLGGTVALTAGCEGLEYVHAVLDPDARACGAADAAA